MADLIIEGAPLVGITYTARVIQKIYQHLRKTMEKDENVHEWIRDELMKKPWNEVKVEIYGQRAKDGARYDNPRTRRIPTSEVMPENSEPSDVQNPAPSSTPQRGKLLIDAPLEVPLRPIDESLDSIAPSINERPIDSHRNPIPLSPLEGLTQPGVGSVATLSTATNILVSAIPKENLSVLEEIKRTYKKWQMLEAEEFLEQIREGLTRSGSISAPQDKDDELARARKALRTRVKCALNYIELKLPSTRNFISWDVFDRTSFALKLVIFVVLVFSACGFFGLSVLDSDCARIFHLVLVLTSVMMEKHGDYNLTINRNEVSGWCYLGTNLSATESIEQLGYSSVIQYVESRNWRSSVFMNIALLMLGLLLAQVVSNFASGTPGIAGFRFNGPIKLYKFNLNFRHKSLQIKCKPKYHLDRFLEERGIYIPEDDDEKPTIDEIYGLFSCEAQLNALSFLTKDEPGSDGTHLTLATPMTRSQNTSTSTYPGPQNSCNDKIDNIV